jgi:hypothetical protein
MGTWFRAIKLLLFVGVVLLLAMQLQSVRPSSWRNFGIAQPIPLVLAITLVLLNIGLAYRKWVLTLDVLSISANTKTKVHSFFAGVVTGVLTPNMLGNFIGRFYYFERDYRLQITAFTLLSNLGQFLASITFGVVAVFWLDSLIVWRNERSLLYLLLLVAVVSYGVYYFIDTFLRLFKNKKFDGVFRNVLKNAPWYRTKLLALSFARFAVFTLQFSLMLVAYGADWSWELIAAIWQVYLLTMLAPSLFLGKIGVKESIALFVLAAFGIDELTVLFASLSVWLINTMLPALVGLIICKHKLKPHE